MLARILEGYPQEQRGRLYYTGPFPEKATTLFPDLAGVLHDRDRLKQCARRFVWGLGFGSLPAPCREGDITLPPWATPYIWGWPNRFLGNARASGCRVFFYLNRPEEGRGLPELPINGVVTDRIEIIGPWLKASGRIG
jgi:glycerophosphoryl diester phosphodiesterase